MITGDAQTCRQPASVMDSLLAVIAALRSEGGCPWDRKQTLETLKRYLVEESCELLDAMDMDEPVLHQDELGDVLLQVLLQARIREEQGAFDFQAVARHLREKLIRRHPHVFGDARAETAEDVVRNWNAIKAQERGDVGPARQRLDELPGLLPALSRAQRVQERAARQGFDWQTELPVLDKIQEEVEEVREALAAGDASGVAEELGDLLFALVNLCRYRKLDAESLLRQATTKFTRRFHAMEDELDGSGRLLAECTPEEMDGLWKRVKSRERPVEGVEQP